MECSNAVCQQGHDFRVGGHSGHPLPFIFGEHGMFRLSLTEDVVMRGLLFGGQQVVIVIDNVACQVVVHTLRPKEDV